MKKALLLAAFLFALNCHAQILSGILAGGAAAAMPVNFGITTIGGNSYGNSSFSFGNVITTGANAGGYTCNGAKAYVDGSQQTGGHYEVAVYTDSAGVPVNRVGTTGAVAWPNNGTSGWDSHSMTPFTLAASTSYDIVLGPDGAFVPGWAYTSPAGSWFQAVNEPFPTPWSGSPTNSTGFGMSVYITCVTN